MHFNWKIGGKAGEGIAATSFLMAKIAQRAGLSVFEYGEYPSLIRGGHTTGQVNAGNEPTVSCQKKIVDLMVVMNEDAIKLHLNEFNEQTKFLVDTQDDKIDFSKYPTIKPEQIISVPMVQFAREATGKSLASNMVALAVSCHTFGLDKEAHFAVIKSFFGRKGQEVVDENIRAAQKGYEWAKSKGQGARFKVSENSVQVAVSSDNKDSTINNQPSANVTSVIESVDTTNSLQSTSGAEKSTVTEPTQPLPSPVPAPDTLNPEPSPTGLPSANETSIAESVDTTDALQSTGPAEKSTTTEPTESTPLPQTLDPKPSTLLLTGTEAIGFGALSAGVQYYSAYPMTPSSALMTFMAEAQADYPLVLKHAEDEIAAINNALGASFAGARAMTGTAGGGFALMVEAVSLAGVTELPLVCVIGGRPGPATGLPTWTSQTDLNFVMYAGHGEFPRIVFTPGNLEECFKLTRLSFLLAEKYHTQSYIVVDKFLLESRMTIEASKIPTEFTNARLSFATDPLPEDGSYRRFPVTPEGYSPRSIPGQPHGLQLTNSYEHDEFGYATEEAKMTQDMVEKRMRKLDGIAKEVPPPVLIGPEEAELTLVSWGSTRLVTEEVMRQMNTNGAPKVNIIHIMTMMPFGKDAFTTLASKAKKLVMIEENIQRQAELHIKKETGITFEHRINRYDGRPFYSEEIVDALETL